MIKIISGLLLLFFLMTACKNAKIRTQPNGLPTQSQTQAGTQNFRLYALNYDFVWHRAVNWFSERNIVIDKMEISSGQISAKYLLKVGGSLLNCMSAEKASVKKSGKPEVGALTVKVSTESQTATRVEVEFFGETCKSSGQLEAEILNYIGKSSQ